ncbi:hypothetical protein CCMSSC00406_0002413 [Pleurotus cornucopiae]|uniref:Uncharacterized protein n=1 Tax=Pleurotus cornucopiae TaxID=5321 RepID=A0ACB7IRU9_PLECO|nr:hypothetical protein CCMSSC00406_0002413 [Pleurotus cornucopiae]
MADAIKLPNGDVFQLTVPYTAREANGVTALVVISCFSLVAVVGLLGAIVLSAFNTRNWKDQNLFVRTHVAAYFISLLLCDFFQAVGSILGATWIRQMGVHYGSTCVAQGVLKHLSDVGSAVWTLVIATNTFCLLFLEIRLRHFVLWSTLIAGWFGIGAIVIAGPASLNTVKKGPFLGKWRISQPRPLTPPVVQAGVDPYYQESDARSESTKVSSVDEKKLPETPTSASRHPDSSCDSGGSVYSLDADPPVPPLKVVKAKDTTRTAPPEVQIPEANRASIGLESIYNRYGSPQRSGEASGSWSSPHSAASDYGEPSNQYGSSSRRASQASQWTLDYGDPYGGIIPEDHTR